MKEKLKDAVYITAVSIAKLYWKTIKPRTYGARVLLVNNNTGSESVLLVRPRRANYWNLPGGGISRSEDPAAGALRELYEETGIRDVHLQGELGVYQSNIEGKRDTIHIIVAKTDDATIPKLEIEIAEAKWFPLSALPENITKPTRYRIEEYSAGYTNIRGLWTRQSLGSNPLGLVENGRRSDMVTTRFEYLIKNHEMGFAVIDLNAPTPELFGYNLDHFIYPASMYKVFIAAEVLRRIELGDFTLNQQITVKSPNDVDIDARIFPGDTRKLLSAGDTVTIEHLIDLMLTRSDNTASNCLINLVGRTSITENIIYKYGWQGSEVTRKYLDRIKEEKAYQFSSTTLSCPRHFAEFFYLVDTNRMVSLWVSEKLRHYMTQFNRQSKLGMWLPDRYTNYYAKGGWLETNLYHHKFISLMKAVLKKHWAIIRWSNDAGVATLPSGNRYVLVVFSITKTLFPSTYFPIQDFAKQLIEYLETEKVKSN